MALIAVDAVVYITGNAGMFRIRLRRRMTGCALENGVVRRVRMASGANSVSAAMIRREPSVVKRCAKPIRGDPGGVACHACRRETRSRMVRVCRSVVVGLVARIAIGRRSGKNTADVAAAAGHTDVRSLKRERRVVMVENGAEPVRCCPRGMANRAILREVRRDVVRHARKRPGVREVLGVAAVAGGGQRSRVIVGVASRARYRRVRSLKRKSSGAVIEVRIEPVDRGVAQRTILREICRHVIRHARNRRRAVVIGSVATVTGGRSARVIAARVALGALQVRVPIGERKKLAVVEIGLIPSGRGMASGARGSGKTSLRVRRIIGCVVIGEVTGGAISRKAFVDAARVAGGASDGDMLARERKRSLGVVVKFSVGPRNRVVAGGANRWSETGLRVRRRGCAVVLRRMTTGASGGRARVIASSVALRALQIRMPVCEREKLVVVEGRAVPASRRMARGARRSYKPCLRVRGIVRAVVIGNVARRAVRRSAGEFAVDMALRARHGYVLADQGERCRVVIEIGVEPSRRVVTQLALLRESRLRVWWIIRRVEILGMTPVAIGGRPLELAPDVTGRALQRCVRPC